jgi:hypothetical protein
MKNKILVAGGRFDEWWMFVFEDDSIRGRVIFHGKISVNTGDVKRFAGSDGDL